MSSSDFDIAELANVIYEPKKVAPAYTLDEMLAVLKEIGEKQPCKDCNGVGFTYGHDLPSTHTDYGECTNCPIQIPCLLCESTGHGKLDYFIIFCETFASQGWNAAEQQAMEAMR